MDWNDWIAEVNKVLREHQVQGLVSLITQYWSHVRHGYKHGQSPQEVAEWLLERNDKYEVLESYADEEGRPTSEGKVIATNLTEGEANRMLDRLWDNEKVWWKQRCSTRQMESSDTA